MATMHNHPIISIIIPAYNSEKTIARTVNSVLNQSYKNWELIIVNDGSQDGTLDVVSKYDDTRIKIFSYENSGGNVARNRGASHTVGNFISFLDADDIWTKDKLSNQFKALQENTNAAVAYSWTNYIDEDDNFLVLGSHKSFNGDVYEELLIHNFLENGSNPLIRKEAFIEVGGFDESLQASQDWDMWLRLSAKYNFVAVKSPDILYRVSLNSVSSELSRQENSCLQVLKKAYQNRKPVNNIRRLSLKNLYKYLTCKSLQEPYSRKKGWMAIIFLYKFVVNNDVNLQNLKFAFKLFVKSLFIFIAPSIISMKEKKRIKYKLT